MFRLAAIVCSVLAALGAGAGPAAASVPAEVYVETLCGEAATLADISDALEELVTQASDAYKALANQANAIVLRDAMIAYFDQSQSSVEDALAAIEGAGIPEVEHGGRFAAAVVAHSRTLGKKLGALATQAAAVNVKVEAKFARDFNKLVNTIDAINKKLQRDAKRDPAFKNQPAVLHPVVVFLTTDAETCPTS